VTLININSECDKKVQRTHLRLVSPILTWAPYGKSFLTVPSRSVPSRRFIISCNFVHKFIELLHQKFFLAKSKSQQQKEKSKIECHKETDPSFPFTEYQLIIRLVYSINQCIYLATHLHHKETSNPQE
jgi:hypothetical protein